MHSRIYLDNAATTAVRQETIDIMASLFSVTFGNPSSLHTEARQARKVVEDARTSIAGMLHVDRNELYFTSGGTESDVLALRGMAMKRPGKMHIITDAVEHHAVLNTLSALRREGMCDVTILPVDREGMVDPEQVRQAIRPETGLVSIMQANNEVGTIMPIHDIAAVCHEHGVLMHCDAVQSVGHIPVDVQEMGVDLLSFSAHKFHGPKGCGGLIARKGILPEAILTGGEQERGLRSGTENVPGIAGMEHALRMSVASLDDGTMENMRDRLIDGILEGVPGAILTGNRHARVPGNASFILPGVSSEQLLALLDMNGIAASAGSACTAGSIEPSHVLQAMGYPAALAKNALRLSLSEDNTMEEMDRTICLVSDIAARLCRNR